MIDLFCYQHFAQGCDGYRTKTPNPHPRGSLAWSDWQDGYDFTERNT